MSYVQIRTGTIHDRVHIHRKGFFAARANNSRDAIFVFVGRQHPARGDRQFSIPKKLIDHGRDPVSHAVPVNVPDCPQMPQELSTLADGPAMPQGCHHRPCRIENPLPGNTTLLRLADVHPEQMQRFLWRKSLFQKGWPMAPSPMRPR